MRTGGKQHRVEPNQLLDVERLPAAVGDTVELLDVLLVADGEDVSVGRPTVTGARVIAEVVEHSREKKIVVFKYKAKTRYRKKIGHRQAYTRLAIRQIVIGPEPEAVAAAETPAKRRPRRAPAKKRAPKTVAEAKAEAAPEATAEVAPEAVAEVTPEPAPEVVPPKEAAKPRRTRAPKAAKAAEETPPKPKRRSRRAKAEAKAAPEATAEVTPEAVAEVTPEPAPEVVPPEEAAKPRRTRAPKAAKAAEETPPKPKRRSKRGE